MKKILILSLIVISITLGLIISLQKTGEIIINPYGITPLSAIYRIENINKLPITVTVKGLYGEQDITHTYPILNGTEFEIHGMYPEATNTIIVNDGRKEIKKEIYIPKLIFNNKIFPSKFSVEIDRLGKEKYPTNPNIYFISFNKINFSIGISRNGYVRYANKLDNFLKVIDEDGLIKIYMKKEGIRSLIGKKYISFLNGTHHDVLKKDNNYILLGTHPWSSEDRVTEIDMSGNIIKDNQAGIPIKDVVLKNGDKSEIEILNKINFDTDNKYIEDGKLKPYDWFHANSTVYDKDTDIIYVSSRHHGVFAIDYSNWKLIWRMADESLETIRFTAAPVTTGTQYQYHYKDIPSLDPYRVKGDGLKDGPKNQHALFLLKNGNLAMFDNQGDNQTNASGSRYVEYKITGTHGNYTATKIYEYRDPSLYSRVTSDIDYTSDHYENLLLYYGTIYTIVEIDKNSKQELFKIRMNTPEHGSSYRVDKMPFYYDKNRIYSEDSNLKK